ncbi:MAG: S8 family serine peptidase [Candidatus Margulisbacteria bacterium]|nr:S8 family serine peptidase [Candidatus Margulisiibacteriota bacterium]
MKNIEHIKIRIVLVMIFCLWVIGASPSQAVFTTSKKAEYQPGKVIVKLKAGAEGDISTLDVFKKIKVLKTKKLFQKGAAVKALDAKFPARAKRKPKNRPTPPDMSRYFVLDVPEDADINSIIAELKENPHIENAQPSLKYQISMLPDDPYYSSSGSWGQSYDDQWGMKTINAPGAWDITTGSSNVIVAVIDTGVDYNHPELSSCMWSNTDEIADNGIDDDGNGYIDDVRGADFYNRRTDPMDDHGHGTHCAGIISEAGNNGAGIAGLSWNSKIMPLKALNSEGYGWEEDLAEAIIYAVDNGADVLSNSWGGWGNDELIDDAMAYAYSMGCVIVAAAGNDSNDVDLYGPANLDTVIAVASINHSNSRSYFSNWGDSIELAAPGEDVLSLRAAGTDMYGGGGHIVGTNYYRSDGTSMACPHVAGVAALVIANKPAFNNEQVRIAMQNSADDLGDAGKDDYYGYSRVNAVRALGVENVFVAPRLNEMEKDFDGNFTLSWISAADTGGIESYELQESASASSSEVFSDDAESGPGKWQLAEGFALSTMRAHSGSYSYFSGSVDYLLSSMSIKDPIAVPSSGGQLSFWCYYDTEEWCDDVLLQVSTNNVNWTQLDRFTGSSGSWAQKIYDLAAYAGSSVYIRFQADNDYSIVKEGFYVDDISIRSFGDFSAIASGISSTSYDVSGRSEGAYAYRVRAKNNSGELSDWSNIEIVNVSCDTTSPEAPSISVTGDKSGGNYTVSWTVPDDESGIAQYNVVETKTGTDESTDQNLEANNITITFKPAGTYSYKVRAQDNCGNWGEFCAEVQVTVSSPRPPAPTVEEIPHYSMTTSMVLRGSRSDGLTIQVNSSSSGVEYPTDGTWKRTVEIKEGYNSFSIKTVDPAGTASLSVSGHTHGEDKTFYDSEYEAFVVIPFGVSPVELATVNFSNVSSPSDLPPGVANLDIYYRINSEVNEFSSNIDICLPSDYEGDGVLFWDAENSEWQMIESGTGAYGSRLFEYNRFGTFAVVKIEDTEGPNVSDFMVDGRTAASGASIKNMPEISFVVDDEYSLDLGASHFEIDSGEPKSLSSLAVKTADSKSVRAVFALDDANKLSDGNHTIKIVAVDGVGNETVWETQLYVVGASIPGMHIYPNPVQIASGANVYFDGLTEDVTVRIYDISGNLVWKSRNNPGSSSLAWPVINSSGRSVVPGIYLYVVITDSGGKRSGKIAVIR